MNARQSFRLLATLAAVLLLMPAARAQLPDSPTGRRGNAIIAVLRGGPTAATPAFFEENFTPGLLDEETAPERSERLARQLERFGAIQLQGVQKTAAYGATILAGTESGAQIEIRYALEEEEPHRITFFDLREAGDAIEPMPLDALRATADEYLASLHEQGRFSGTVLVARNDEIVLETALGLANRRFEVPNTVGTPFNLGSINKLFTKLAIGQLARNGKLSLDDTIATHLPDYPNPEVAVRVTIAQIANHTAGLGDIFTEAFADAAKSRFREPADYFPLFAEDPLLFEPGTDRRYSNGGYMVLGAIVEAASGQSYHDYVREKIFEPAGMTASGPFALDDPTQPMATGYTRVGDDHEAGPLRENSFRIPHSGTAAGGGYSTLRDLLAFRHAFVHQRLLDGPYLAWIATDQLPEVAPEIPPDGYGLGVAGGGPGVNAALEIDGEWTIVVLANLDPPSATEVAARLRALTDAVVAHERGSGEAH